VAASEPERGPPGASFDVERSSRYRLAALSRLWTSSSERIYDERHGVSLSEWRIIAIVGTKQPINAGAIADRGLLEKSHISRLVARLIGRRLLSSELDRDDARKSWLYLTPGGRAIFDDIAVISLDRDRQFVAPLTARERNALDRLLDKLLADAPR